MPNRNKITTIYDEKYLFTTNVNEKLSKILEIDKFNYDKKFKWNPPKEHGLTNSNNIIPKYYQKDNKKILDVDYYNIIKDDIRNMRKLNNYQLDYIKNLNCDEHMEIINIFNDSFDLILEYLND